MNEVPEKSEESQRPGRTVDERMADRLRMIVPTRGNRRLARLLEMVNEDDELYALWTAANVTAIERLGMSDHGPVHVKIVTNLAVKMLRVLVEHGIAPSVVTDYGLEHADAEVVVSFAAMFHDVGMSIHRSDHEEFSLFVAQPILTRLLDELYGEPATATILRSEVLHAIIAHRSGGRPLTVEAGVLRIADALDMAKGRSRIPFEAGSLSIHSVSAAAIEGVRIEHGEEKPVRIGIEMSNSAGVFQIDELFRSKLKGSGLEPYVELEARVEGEGADEKRLIDRFRL